ncbi:ABC transporter permease [Candidatus Peregrinibacteria bacterium]|nr:ABC transporter permease [Candidatus Peregrinibacteria bacterium]
MYLQLIALQSIVRREIVRFLRIWVQTLLPPVITQTLYFVIFGTFIGSQLREINGVSYMAFIVPGLVMMAVINSSFSNVVSSFFGSKFQRNLEEMLVAPVKPWVMIWGFISGGILRGLLVGLLVFFISFFFTWPSIHNFGIILLFIVLTAVLFSMGGMVNGIFAKKFDDVQIFPTFVLIPLTYFGGVFYSIKDLPEFWQTVSQFNPVLYMVDGFRYGFYGFSDVNIWFSIFILIAFTLIVGIINAYLIRKGIGLKS